MTFDSIIDRLLDEGICITMEKDEGVVWFDLNTNMKSHLHISKGENGCHNYRARYDLTGEFETFDELVERASDCMCGRDYAHPAWAKLLSAYTEGKEE